MEKKRTTKRSSANPAEKKATKTVRRTKTVAVASNGPEERLNPSKDEIARKAYELWESRGKPMGSPDEDWYKAEREFDTIGS